MKKFMLLIPSFLLVCCLSVVVYAKGEAKTSNEVNSIESQSVQGVDYPEEGGVWSHGVCLDIYTFVYSDYWHPSSDHRSSCQGANGKWASKNGHANEHAESDIGYDWSGKTNHTYYDIGWRD